MAINNMNITRDVVDVLNGLTIVNGYVEEINNIIAPVAILPAIAAVAVAPPATVIAPAAELAAAVAQWAAVAPADDPQWAPILNAIALARAPPVPTLTEEEVSTTMR